MLLSKSAKFSINLSKQAGWFYKNEGACIGGIAVFIPSSNTLYICTVVKETLLWTLRDAANKKGTLISCNLNISWHHRCNTIEKKKYDL